MGRSPKDGYITYVDGVKIQSHNPGYCFQRAGFRRLNKRSSKGLYIFQLDMDNNHYLIQEELNAKEGLLYHQDNIQLALDEGEWMEIKSLLKEAVQQQEYLLGIQREMKRRKIKAESEFPITMNE